jgi:hypothetical protein
MKDSTNEYREYYQFWALLFECLEEILFRTGDENTERDVEDKITGALKSIYRKLGE